MLPCSCTTQSWLERWSDDHYPDPYKWMTPLHDQVLNWVKNFLEVSVLLPVRFPFIHHVLTSCRRRWHCLHYLRMYLLDVVRHGLTIPALTGVQPYVLHSCRQTP